jgi:hypothetical protein
MHEKWVTDFKRLLTYNWKKHDVEVTLVTDVHSKVLRMKFMICCKGDEQRSEALHKVPLIQNALINEVKEREFTISIVEHNLDEIRKRLLRVVNREISSPVKGVYMDQFFFN